MARALNSAAWPSGAERYRTDISGVGGRQGKTKLHEDARASVVEVETESEHSERACRTPEFVTERRRDRPREAIASERECRARRVPRAFRPSRRASFSSSLLHRVRSRGDTLWFARAVTRRALTSVRFVRVRVSVPREC